MGTLSTALGGLLVHQNWIDIIGNNLANSNTPGFKSSRAVFSDLLSNNLQVATPPTATIGGKNPIQVGLGVRLSNVQRDLAQGALELTGRPFDLAIQGQGYFALTDGTVDLFTRVGTFGLDGQGNLVDVRTGYRVLDTSGQPFKVDTDIFQPKESSSVTFTGNLPAVVTGPLAQELTSGGTFKEGVPALHLATPAQPPTYDFGGQVYTMSITVNGGAAQEISITAPGTLTAAEIVDEINDQAVGITASVTGASSDVVQLSTSKVGDNATIKVTQGSPSTDLAALLGFSQKVEKGQEFAATGTTDFNDLVINNVDYVDGDAIEVSGTDADGTPISATFVYGTTPTPPATGPGDGTTLDDLVVFLQGQYTEADVSYNPVTQKLEVMAKETGESALSLVLLDGENNTAGDSTWATHAMAIDTAGAGPDTVTASAEMYDSTGISHLVSFIYERQADATWTMTVVPDEEDSVVAGGTITGITFDTSGSLLTPPSASFQIGFPGHPPQTISIDFITTGDEEVITQLGSNASLIVDSQDGYGVGELASVTVNIDGAIQGFYTNGQTQTLGQFAIALFKNAEGLESAQDGYLRQTSNSGQPVLTPGNSSGAGDVIGGALETSNVDTAEEFVRLIEAQRGFQANARVITIQNDVLAEVVNLI